MLLSPIDNSYTTSPYGYASTAAAGNTAPGMNATQTPGGAYASDLSSGKKVMKEPGEECQTCKNRKYQDGSDEMVSFKSPRHVSPEASGTAVRAHEQEHVSNAYTKAASGNGKVLSASVTLKTAICPECGRSYVAGGTTQTQIKYYNEENPYQKGLKTADSAKYAGMHADFRV